MVLASLDSDAFKMQTESQISTESEALLHPGNAPVQNEDGGLGPSTPPNNIVLQQPVKKTTRQWAAWTRQEEESFFTALRQVGKNFEKITHRVQSKNKDQVRHYYYRLVRRMNKLLGPGLSLDAKNSKDTNAAMLRWWSLLEKYSCKASKLHLKPRRFKIFIEALEHQLLKDRKRNVKKRSCQGENSSPTSPDCVSNQSRASGQDTCTVKLVFVDSQNIQKLGPAKGSLKRNVSMGVNRNSNKGESTSMKPTRQRRKPGVVSSAAFKKWEKAAIAGVSLVADAAEHLERSTTDKEMKLDQVQKDIHSAGRALPPLPSAAQDPITESNINIPVKLKLQLFPIDDGTRRALEMDNHNPHLELTLSSRKRISSVLEHLNRKWGSSAIASGELTLFPYVVQRENLVGHQRWTRVSTVSAADVYAMIGSPPLFRLRYGWFSNAELDSVALQAPSVSSCTPCVHSVNVESRKDPITTESPTSVPLTSNQSEKHMDPSNLQLPSVDENAGDMRLSNSPMLSTNEWADSLTNISIGDLLLDAPQDMDGPVAESSQCLNEIPFSCDSFDAAIAAHISRHQNKMVTASTFGSHASSIWDAEETCDAFSFQKNATLSQGVSRFPDIASPATCKPAGMNSELPDAKEPIDYTAYGNPMDECPTDPQALDHSVKDFSGLTDISWPDSLGPLDLDIPSSKYRGDDLFLGDSLGGLSRLIASSLDAFQNCSFFGLDKKESTPTAEARENAPLSDFKIGSRG